MWQKWFSIPYGTALEGKNFAPSGSKFFPLREVPILKRDAIEENHCLVRLSPFDAHSFFSVLATPLVHSLYSNRNQTVYLPEASSIMRALSGARCTDARLYTLWIKIGTNQRALGERSHYWTRLWARAFWRKVKLFNLFSNILFHQNFAKKVFSYNSLASCVCRLYSGNAVIEDFVNIYQMIQHDTYVWHFIN